MIEAVTFDFWNTLMYETDGSQRDLRIAAWLGLLDGEGFSIERREIEVAFEEAWRLHHSAWRANRQVQGPEAAAHAIDVLGYDIPPSLREELIHYFVHAGATAELHATEGIADTLRDLSGLGVGLGIICDVGFTSSPLLRSHLERKGLLRFFTGWSFSDEIGVFKPDPAIFRHALAYLGIEDPSVVAHVGDLRRTDVAGALAMGMTAVRYAGVFDDPGTAEESMEGHVVIADHRDLIGALGLR